MTEIHPSLHTIVQDFCPNLTPYEEIYRDIHANPELGRQEERTSKICAQHLRSQGYAVQTHIGGYGLVGVLHNGPGPTVLLRADMDALPIKEATGLSYASKVQATDPYDGLFKPVMHACGHDMHIAALLAASTLLQSSKTHWTGTLIILFQPDEEHGAGAQRMLDWGLYTTPLIPYPDIVLGQHVTAAQTGTVLIRPGVFMASADTLQITIHGQASHAAQPQDAIDPIVTSAFIITRLQTIVSREVAPADAVALSCTSIEAGSAHNIIPPSCTFTLNIRTFNPQVRDLVLAAVKRIIRSEASASGATRDPEIEQLAKYPLTINYPSSTAKLSKVFTSYFGQERTLEAPVHTASEDFSLLASSIGVPSIFWNFGGSDEEAWREHEEGRGEQLAMPHQAGFKPVIEPTLSTGIEAMSLAALTFLGPGGDKRSDGGAATGRVSKL